MDKFAFSGESAVNRLKRKGCSFTSSQLKAETEWICLGKMMKVPANEHPVETNY